MIHLQRITTQYIDTEDRIRLSGESGGNRTLVLWLTQRLLAQLISHLVHLLENHSSEPKIDVKAPMSSLMQGFAQQAANSELVAESPVRAQADTENWLVQEVDVALNAEGALILVFKRGAVNGELPDEAAKATLTVEAKQLRQWLGIIHAQWLQAGWPIAVWPSWMDEHAPPDSPNPLH